MPKSFTQGIKKEKKGRKSPSTVVKEEKCLGINEVVHLNPYPFKNGDCLEVVVTEVLSPWELWIQPANNGFNLLMEKMCFHFANAGKSGQKGGLTVPPLVGEYCCGRFLDDDTWYRVVVIGIHQSTSDTNNQGVRGRKISTGSVSSTSSIDSHYPGLELEVLCIDDGSRDRLPLSRLRRLDKVLADIPCQAICCALNGVQPLVKMQVKSQGDSVWNEDSIEWLRNKVSGVKLLAYPKRTDDDSLIMVDLYLTNFRKPAQAIGQPRKDGTIPGIQFSIAYSMVLEGFAQQIGHVTSSPANSKPSSPKSLGSGPSSCRNSVQSFDGVLSEKFNHKDGLKDGKEIHKSSAVIQQDKQETQGKIITGNLNKHSASIEKEKKKERIKEATKPKQSVGPLKKEPKTKEVSKKRPQQTSQDTLMKQAKELKVKPKDKPSKVEADQLSLKDQGEQSAQVESNQVDVKSDPERASPRFPPEGSSQTDSVLGDGLSVPRDYYNDYLLQVMMSEVVNPSEFYVHLVTPEAVLLSELTEDLDSYYKGEKNMPKDYHLSIGDYCCAKFSLDNMWCRAKVLDVKCSPAGEGDSENVATIHVFYVDYGNSEWVAMGDTRPLLAKFMMLPGFAVKCYLAGVHPVAEQDDYPTSSNAANDSIELENDKQPLSTKSIDKPAETTLLSETVKQLTSRKKSPRGRQSRKNKKIPLHDRNVILRAAGDESGDSEHSDCGLIFDLPSSNEKKPDVQDKANESALPEMYLVASPEKDCSADATISRKPLVWTEEAIELFKGLTGDDKPLCGVMIPWNASTYQQVYSPTTCNSMADITYQRPILALRLYDTTEEEDIDIVQIMVETGLAELSEESLISAGNEMLGQESHVRKIHLSIEDLESTAQQLEKEGNKPLLDSDSEEEDIVKFFNPMMDDYKSSRNAYGIDTNDLDIAIHGFKPVETQYCRFYRNSSTRCWRGDNCPFLHVKEGEDASQRVQAFCNNNDFTIDLPKVNSWIGVRVTAVINPGHFWVNFPLGTGPIEKKILEERLGLTEQKNADDDEDFDALLERMNKFYSRNLFRESTTINPAPGELAVAKYSGNGQWYRACVLDVLDDKIYVTYVDFGNTEWTDPINVKRMLPQFLHMPFQAVECFLSNVEPIEENEEWSKESIELFESLTQDKLLIAHVLSISQNNTMWLELYDTQADPEININDHMIKQGFAYESPVKISIPGSPVNSVGSDSSECDIVFVPG